MKTKKVARSCSMIWSDKCLYEFPFERSIFQIYGALLMLEMFAIGWKLDRDCCKLLLDTKVSISFFFLLSIFVLKYGINHLYKCCLEVQNFCQIRLHSKSPSEVGKIWSSGLVALVKKWPSIWGNCRTEKCLWTFLGA